MGVFKVYVKPFDTRGEYQEDFIDVSRDVLKVGDTNENLDSTEYELGIFRLSGIKITLRNDHGRFSSPPNSRSIFNYKRKDSQVKITWNIRPEPLCVGFFKAGQCGPVGEEIEIYRGLLNETTAASDINSRTIEFDVLGMESLLDRVTVPYADINLDNMSDVFYSILNQSQITSLLSVSLSNINPGLDQVIDVKNDLENKTAKEALGSGNNLLFLSQSVLTTKDQVIEIKTRDPSNDVKFSFYGQSSQLGNENIIDIKNYREGFNKVRNFWAWEDTSLTSQSNSSVEKFGIQKREIDSTIITDSTKRQNILTSLKDDFSEPKIEMTLVAPLTNDTAKLSLLDKVDIDYPTVYLPSDNNPLPVWGREKWGEFLWPIGSFELTINQLTKFKILSRKIKVKDEIIEFKLREV